MVYPTSLSTKEPVPQPRQPRNGRSNNRGAPSSRSKRAAILDTATELFGREGYEYSKWADVATALGIGSTALYHYFESKLHCLYSIMAEALAAEVERFERSPAGTRTSRRRSPPSWHRLRPLRTGGPAQPPAGLRAGAGRRPSAVPARGGGAAARARAYARPRVRLGGVPVARDGAGRDPRSRSAPAHARGPRALQQRLPLVPPARRAIAPRGGRLLRPRCLAVPACRYRARTAPSLPPGPRSARARARPSAEAQAATGSR